MSNEIIPGSGRPIRPKELSHILSLRVSTALVSALRDMATQRGVTLSDLLREALDEYAEFHALDDPAAFDEAMSAGESVTVLFGPPPVRGHNAHGPQTMSTGPAVVWMHGCPRCDEERQAS